MSERRDVVVTVPKQAWAAWLAEGDLPGQQQWPCFFCAATGRSWPLPGRRCEACRGAGRQHTGQAEWHFYLGGRSIPTLHPGARCYVVAHGRLRGYAPVTAIERYDRGFAIVRRGDAMACTISEPVRGFQGWRYRWWDRADEHPFVDWQTAGIP